MKLLIAILVFVPFFAHAEKDPVYVAIDALETQWKACYKNNAGSAFLACVNGVADNAVSWEQRTLPMIRSRVAARPNSALMLKRFDRLFDRYPDFERNQCQFEAWMRSGEYSEQELQRARCRFRRASDNIIYLFDNLGLFGDGERAVGQQFQNPPPERVTPQFSNAIEKAMYEIRVATQPCFQAATTVKDKMECAKQGAGNMKAFLDFRTEGFITSLASGVRGDVLSPLLRSTHDAFILFRRDFCNFVGEYYQIPGAEEGAAALRGNSCVFRITTSRVREMYQLK